MSPDDWPDEDRGASDFELWLDAACVLIGLCLGMLFWWKSDSEE